MTDANNPLRTQVSLQPLNALALPGKAAHFLEVRELGQLQGIDRGTPRFILGGGSNLVVRGDVEGLLVQVALRGRRLLREDDDAWVVAAAGGENWHAFVQWTLAHGWPGLENLALIPGTVGAAPIQNIGAYGLELAERFHQLTAFDFGTGTFRTFSRDECRFAYRHSIFKQEGWHLDGRYLISEVVFRLPKAWQGNTRYSELAEALAARGIERPQASEIAAAVIAIRQKKLPDPATLPNAGSFFQNPVVDAALADSLRAHFPDLPAYPQADGRFKLAAGWLIDQCGWKGRQLGPVGMYRQQALVLVNHGGGTGADVVRLMRAVQADVEEKFGVALQPEPIFVGQNAV